MTTAQSKSKKFEVDAAGRAPGRIATEVALLLRGKNDPSFAPHIASTNRVRVINADKMKFTGKKLEQKMVIHHSGYPGGLKMKPLKKLFAEDSRIVVRKTVWNMLPKNKLRKELMKHLSVDA
ncbi:MAG: 50S ribosomal protein L13 [Patescibacteria group bacterium]